MSRVTIKDIASQLNVSIATVDRALHNRGRIHEETYKQIMLKVDELGYKPNRIASTLVKNTDTRIAFVTPKCNSFFEEIVRGAQTAADELLDFGVYIDFITQDSFFDSLGQAASMESLIEQKPDGILVVPLHPLLLSTSIDRASENGIPVITVNLDSKESKRICYVGQDPEKTGAIIGTLFGKHMNKGGDIVILNGITEISTLRLRADGFINRLKNSYPGINIIGSYEYVDDIKISFEIAKKIIKDIPSVSGIFANTAYGGVGVGMAIKEMGKCGSIVAAGFDTDYGVLDLLDCGALKATITQNPYMEGYHSVKLLYKTIAEKIVPEREYNYTKADIIISSEQYELNEWGVSYNI